MQCVDFWVSSIIVFSGRSVLVGLRGVCALLGPPFWSKGLFLVCAFGPPFEVNLKLSGLIVRVLLGIVL